jgi:glycosyltransferase involved in cell wall biosynthesis
VYRSAVPRLLFVTGTAPDVAAGSGTYVGISVLREALEGLGCAVDFVAPPAGRGPVSLVRRLYFNLSIRDVAKRLQPDALVGFDWDGLWLEDAGSPHIASLKGVIAEEAAFERGLPRLRLKTEARLEKRHVRRADRVLATSQHSASRIARAYGVSPECIAVVPEPIDLARWRAALESAEALPKDRPSILCVAHLYPRKDVATLLKAMVRLPPEVVLRVAGTGPELPSLRSRAAQLALGDRVEFLQHVPFARLAAEYRRADIFCLPSRQEGFGIVFLEAMAAALPIVAARAAAVPEVVPDGECGVLVEPRNAWALAGALERLFGDADERQRLGQGGRKRVERYNAPLVARRFLEAIGLEARAGTSPAPTDASRLVP